MEGRDSQQQEEVCPLCKELGRNGILLLRQINAHEAIYVCNNPECPYPVGVVSPDEATVQSPASELLGLWTPAPNGATSGTGMEAVTAGPSNGGEPTAAQNNANSIAGREVAGSLSAVDDGGLYLDTELDDLLTSLLEEI